MSASLTSATPIATSSSAIPTDIARITGPLLFGPLVNWGLYGVLCVQIYVYSYNFPDDKPIVKCLAYLAFLLETVQTALTGADVYYWFIAGFGNVERLKDSHFAAIDIPIIHSTISFVVQGYFCYRIWTLNRRSSKLCVLIALLTILSSIGSGWGGIESAMAKKFAVSRRAFYVWSIPSALVDTAIAIAMTLLLSRARDEGGRYSNFIMLRLVRLTIETNALTASVAITSFILYVAFPNDIYYVFTTAIIGKIYTNTLLVSLNNRIYFRDHPAPGAHVDTIHFDQGHRSAMAPLHFAPVGSHAHPTVTILGDGHKVMTMSQTIDPEKGMGDAGSNKSNARCQMHAIPEKSNAYLVEEGMDTGRT